MDFDSLVAVGSMMGSGGLVVMDEDTCMVDVARFFTAFNEDESCGKCSTCRLGTQRLREILERICAGQGKMSDLEALTTIGNLMKEATLCGLGQTAPNPVLSTIRYFRDEYEAHILEHRCPARVCKTLIRYRIHPDLCTGCMACARQCPTGAAHGERKQPHIITQETCIKCGACQVACKFGAVTVE
jgi:NAD-dependent dihydropyrimidine dehydrogenase PreA subunit